MNFRRSTFKIVSIFLAVVVASTFTLAGRNTNPTVSPINSNSHGQSYGNWGGEWWAWALGVPLANNPILDPDGGDADIDQSGSVWFLAGTFGGTAERDVTIPPGKSLFFPIANAVWWAPDDLGFAAFVVEDIFGLDPNDFTDEELIEFMAVFQTTFDSFTMSCTVDGKEIQNLEDYYAVSDPFPIDDTDLLDDLGIPIADDNFAVAAGYWLMLAPLSRGEHTINFTFNGDHFFFGAFALDVTYDITVE